MEIVKKNLIAIICGAVALVAIIAWFWPIGSMYGSFQEKLTGRQKAYKDIQGLVAQKFTVPRLGPDTDPLPEPGTWFPTPAAIEETKKKTAELQQKANETLATAVRINRLGHDLLEPQSLPAPEGNHGYHFRSQYNAVMDRGGKPERDPARRDPWPLNLPDEVLNSTPLPTEADIKDALDKKWKDEYEQKIIVANGQQVNLKEIQAQFATDTANFAHDYYLEKARSFKLYMDDTALVRAPGLGPSTTPSATEIWFGQMTLWVEQDVCQAIHDLNAKVPGRGVAASPVKNLMEVSLAPDVRMYVTTQDITAGVAPGAAAGAAGGTAPTPTEPTQLVYSKSPTGRVCNSLYDVVQFRVVAVLDARQVQAFLEQLRFGRFITVLNMQTQAVDTRAAEDQGYSYGNAPCVQVTLDCESLFMRDWTAPTRVVPGCPAPGTGPMPADIQQKLGVPAPTPATPGATPGRVALGQ